MGPDPPARTVKARAWRRRAAVLALAAASLALAAVLAVGEVLTRPVRSSAPPAPAGLNPAPIVVPGPDGAVRGWHLPGTPGRGLVVLLHGLRGSRLQMLARARFLQQAGYGAVLVDLPAHGDSEGARITFGARESGAVRALMRHVRATWPAERVAVVGVSLGAASFVLAELDEPPAAAVLESLYPTIREAVEDRLTQRLGPLGRWGVDPLLWQLPLRLGVSEQQLRPIDRVARLHLPLALASGSEDRHTRWPQTQRLFDAAAPPKELWRFEGAAHEDLHAFAPADYQQRLLRFLGRHLRGEG